MEDILIILNDWNTNFAAELESHGFIVQTDWDGKSPAITVDMSKGYTVQDVLAVATAIQADSSNVYIGYNPNGSFGRKTFSTLFWFIHSKRLTDIHSGLRSYPAHAFPENNHPVESLIDSVRSKLPVEEVKLSTASETSTATFRDVLILFRTFFKYIGSSFASFVVDISLFQLIIFLFAYLDSDMRIVLATVVSRVCSSIVNYVFNKKVVFNNDADNPMPALKYFSLVVTEMFTSAFFVAVLYRLTRLPETPIKLLVDFVLFFVGYIVEKVFIFDA